MNDGFVFEDTFPPYMPTECIDEYLDHHKCNVLYEFLRSCDDEKWYAIRFRTEEIPFCPHADIDGKTIRVYLDIKAVEERPIVYKTNEEALLTPAKSLREKLKNCFRYLKKG